MQAFISLFDCIKSSLILFDVSSLVSLSELGPALFLAPNSAEVHTIHILFQFFFNMYVSLFMVDSVDSLLCENSNNTFCKYQLMGLTWLTLFFKVREGLKY